MAKKQPLSRLAQIRECLLSLRGECDDDIQKVTELCGRLMGGDSAFYNRLEGPLLRTCAKWQAPPDLPATSPAEGHICCEVIRKGGAEPWVIRNLDQGPFAKDPNVSRYGLKTYMGHPVMYGGNGIGSLCVVFQRDHEPSAEDLELFGILAAALGAAERWRVTLEGLQEAKGFLDSIVENVPDMIFVKDAQDLRFVLFNRAGERLLGYDRGELIGKNDYDFFPKKEADFFTSKDRDVIDKGELLDIPEEPIQTKNGPRLLHTKKIPIRDQAGRNAFLLGISEDITETRKREQQMLEAQKLESLGRLAGGIAHEFNNILTGIMGFASMVKSSLGESHPSKDDVEEIIVASRRAVDLVSQVLTFSRQVPSQKSIFNLNELIERNLKMVRAAVGERIKIQLDLASDLPTINANFAHMEQVLLNLCLNSRDAMAETGCLRIETHARRLESPLSCAQGSLPGGAYAVLTVADDGSGIAPEDLKRIFEPFFTTKAVGQGTGLGLSICYGIIKEHGGSIDAKSALGRGTAVQVYLPACAQAQAEPEAPAAAAAHVKTRSHPTILIADDDAVIRSMLQKILQMQGFTVLAAQDGEEAVGLFQAHMAEVDIVLLDVIMPKLDGVGAYERIRGLRPDTKVVFMSGHATAQAEAVIRSHPGGFISKPFQPDELARRLQEVLNA
ncbi:MAG: response regulator [Elusimicrobia bacterium]|nr:response regulator [Elusimicrobiota bacterium]